MIYNNVAKFLDRQVPYNGIFSRRQIFAVLSKKHGDYFSRLATSAKNNFYSFGTTRLSLDRSTVRKENLRPKYLKRKGIKHTCSLIDKQTKITDVNIQMVQ